MNLKSRLIIRISKGQAVDGKCETKGRGSKNRGSSYCLMHERHEEEREDISLFEEDALRLLPRFFVLFVMTVLLRSLFESEEAYNSSKGIPTLHFTVPV